MADLESRINRIASRVAKLYRDPHPRDELEFKRRRPSNYELNDLDDEENIDFVNNDSFENVSDYFDTEGELDTESFCSSCENENAKDVRTEREWVDLYLKEGLLKDGVDPREFDDEDPICSDCAEELLESYFADTADRRIASVRRKAGETTQSMENPVYGGLIYNKMTDVNWMWVGEDDDKVWDAWTANVKGIKAGEDVDLVELVESIASRPGIELVSDENGNLESLGKWDEWEAEYKGEMRPVLVIGSYSERF